MTSMSMHQPSPRSCPCASAVHTGFTTAVVDSTVDRWLGVDARFGGSYAAKRTNPGSLTGVLT